MKTDIKIQLLEVEIINIKTTELKDALDKDYKYLVGIAIANDVCSEDAIIEIAKVKGYEFLPEDFEAVNIVSSISVEPNKRFFTLFNAVKINGDDLVIHVRDPGFTNNYDLKIQALLTNHPEEVKDA